MNRNSHFAIRVMFVSLLVQACEKTPQQEIQPPPAVTPSPGTTDSLPTVYRNCPNWICLSGPGFQNAYSGALPNMGTFGAAITVGSRSFFAGGHGEGTYPLGDLYGSLNILDEYFNISYRNLSEARSHLSAAHAGSKVLFAGGCDASTFLQEGSHFFDNVDVIESADPIESVTTSRLSERKAYMASASLGGKAYFIGGRNVSSYSSRMEVFDGANGSWAIIPTPGPRANASASVHGSSIYVGGGEKGPGSPAMTVDVYDATSGAWSVINCPHPHPVASSAVLKDKLYIAGGYGEKGYVDVLDIPTGVWHSVELPDARSHIAMAATTNALVLFGGDFSNKVDIYHVESDQWDHATLNDGVSGAVATVRGSAVIVAGYLFGKGSWLGPMYLKIML